MLLSHTTCLITGGSRGLGAVLVRRFWTEGASVCVCARDAATLGDLARSLVASSSAKNQRCTTIACDLADSGARAMLLHRVRAEMGGVDILVNNAALQGPIGPLWENDPSRWEETVRVNLVVPAVLCAAVIPWMKERGRGKIINLSGGGAANGRSNFSAYAAAKAGLVRLTETLAQETRGMGIDVNCVAPGAMPTQMLNEIKAAGRDRAGAGEYDAALGAEAQGESVMQRAADLCLLLASAACDGISGRLISAKWDPWEDLPRRRDELTGSDIYTLRRIVPGDRGKHWGPAS